MKTLDKAQVHRFQEFVAVSIGKGETLYLTHDQAVRLGSALQAQIKKTRALQEIGGKT